MADPQSPSAQVPVNPSPHPLQVREALQAIVAGRYWATPEVGFEAPDGFFYVALFHDETRCKASLMGSPELTPKPYQISDLVQLATDTGYGLACNPDQEQPEWLLTYGHLWSFRQYGVLDVNYQDSSRQSGSGEEPTLAAAFPDYARTVLRRFLERAGLQNVGVQRLVDSAADPNSATVALTFSIFPEQFTDADQFEAVQYMIDWHLPPHYEIRTVEKSSDIIFEPL